MNRRDILKFGLTSAIVIPQLLPSSAIGQQSDFWSQPRTLSIYRPASNQIVQATYFADGQIIWPEYDKLCKVLGDIQTGQYVQMSPVLLDILSGLQGWLRSHKIHTPLQTNSGFRSQRTNSKTEGASKDSLHMYGKAWDGKVAGVSTESLAKFARFLRGGGVGLYEDKDFLHIDDGSIRAWRR